jgi:ketosteroid isomerase-like protein
MPQKEMINRFYTAFANRDFRTMQSFYHDDAEFNDPVFQTLNSKEVKAMWQMLLSSSKDLTVSFSEVEATDHQGSCRWDAFYTFSQTNGKVHNIIHAKFEFKDGKILKHRDHFDFWRWSRMALGLSGILLGWTPFLKNKVSTTAKIKLKKFMGTM